MGCNCSKKKLSTNGKKITKNINQSKKPIVKTSRRMIVRRTSR